MALHPKLTLFGTLLLTAVSAGLAMFVLGRVTAGENLTRWLIGTGIGLGIVTVAGVAILKNLPVSRYFDGVMHTGAQFSDEGYVSAPRRLDLVGKEGVAVSELRPVGTAEIDGERVDVTTDGEYLTSGTPIRVVRADNMKVVVRPAPRLTA